MPYFRKKPIVIEAVQWWPGLDVPGVEYMRDQAPAGGPEGLAFPVVRTLEGLMNVAPGNWIITGVAGERYPCKDAIFRATYEPYEAGE